MTESLRSSNSQAFRVHNMHFEQVFIRQIHRAIDATACNALSEIFHMTSSFERAFDFEEEAVSIAISLAWETDVLPQMFENHLILREAWETTREVIVQEQTETLRCAARRAQQELIESYIAAGNWVELGLPAPPEALLILLAGDQLEANGHTTQYDSADDVTWYTNPYGVDGILCTGKPTLERVTAFLGHMARGKDYGPVPS